MHCHKDSVTGRSVRLTATLIGLCLTFLTLFSCPIHAVSSAEIEARAGLPWTEKFRTNIQESIDLYNKKRAHKAIAVAVSTDNIRVAQGFSWGAESAFAAAAGSLSHCENQRTRRNIEGACEIVVSNETIIPLGKSHFDDIDPTTPSNVWHISRGDKETYIVGSIHVLKPTIFPLPRSYELAYQSADQLALETNVLLMTDPERAVKIQKLVAVDAKQLRKETPRKLRKSLKSFVRKHGGSTKTLYNVKPISISLGINQLTAFAQGYSGASGMEMHFSRRALTDGKAILELEDFEATTRLMTDLPLPTQFKVLQGTLDSYDQQPELFDSLLSRWIEGDAEGLYELATKPFLDEPELAEFGEAFINDRNLAMLERIRPLIDSPKTTTIMVGAGHLGGPKGIITLLKKEGYAPVQLDVAGEKLGESPPTPVASP